MKNKKIVPTESQVSKSIKQWLGLMPQVIWFERLNSGKVLSAMSGRWMQLCAKGTPDFVALVKDTDRVHVLFIEAKKPGGYQSDEQKWFAQKVQGFSNVHYIVAKSASEVTSKINELS